MHRSAVAGPMMPAARPEAHALDASRTVSPGSVLPTIHFRSRRFVNVMRTARSNRASRAAGGLPLQGAGIRQARSESSR